MRLHAYAERLWLSNLNPLDHPPAEMPAGFFSSRFTLTGRDWLAQLPAVERQEFSMMGRQRQSDLDIPLQSLGGQARLASRCPNCGCFRNRKLKCQWKGCRNHGPSNKQKWRDRRAQEKA